MDNNTAKQVQYNLRNLGVLLPHLFKKLITNTILNCSCIAFNETQAMTLLALTKHNPATMGEIHHHSRLTKGALTQVIDSFEEKGIIERTRNKQDRRTVQVTLTEKGQELGKKIEKEMTNQLGLLLDKIDEEKRNELITSLVTSATILEEIENIND
ncbi:MAG: MarR family transcriptional regulator [Sphaerochaetaceae bacterium]